MLGITQVFCYYTDAFQCEQDEMATLSRCLCLFLTLWMAGSRRPAVPRTVASDPWWGTQEALEIRRSAEQLRGARDFAGAEAVYQRGYDIARKRHDDYAAFAFL